tara:strand:+ start:1444 stop:2112 length:669 start_codon:yes stop_codon:yes gene_type:complete
MISWLKGQIIKNWHHSSKSGVVINVGGVGYEVQLLSKQIDISDNYKINEFWIHQIIREDCINLYGFKDINQRDLFRKIITVNGIGPQIGMALLEDFEVIQLVSAIEENDLNLLTKSQGIGNRIAERLVIELKSKLKQFKDNEKETTKKKSKSNNFANYVEEIKSILISLGYLENEIKDSIEIIKKSEIENQFILDFLSKEEKAELMDKHLKEILISLSQKST